MADEYCAGLDTFSYAKLPVWTRACLAASDLFGWHYPGEDGNHFPFQRKSLPSQLVKPGVAQQGIDCSTQSSYLLTTMFPYGLWTSQTYADLQIFDANRPWSPMDAVVAAKVGVVLAKPEDAPVGAVLLSQAWVDATPPVLSGGHARVVRVQANGVLEVLESTNKTGPYNPLGFGPTRSYTTWATLRAKYVGGIKVARLNS